MGMYDYMGGNQIKCFYQPVVCHDLEDLGLPLVSKLDMFASGGGLHEYRHFSKVPFKTMWYDYTPNFMIFDPKYSTPNGIVHIIRFGRYVCSVNYQVINPVLFPITTVIDTHGTKLKISKKEDFGHMLRDYVEYMQFGDSRVNQVIMDNHLQGISSNMGIGEETVTAWTKFEGRWYEEDPSPTPWIVGGFIDGISNFCKTDDVVQKFVGFFKDANKEINIDELIVDYALWCAHHSIPIELKNLRNLFGEKPTMKDLRMCIWEGE